MHLQVHTTCKTLGTHFKALQTVIPKTTLWDYLHFYSFSGCFYPKRRTKIAHTKCSRCCRPVSRGPGWCVLLPSWSPGLRQQLTSTSVPCWPTPWPAPCGCTRGSLTSSSAEPSWPRPSRRTAVTTCCTPSSWSTPTPSPVSFHTHLDWEEIGIIWESRFWNVDVFVVGFFFFTDGGCGRLFSFLYKYTAGIIHTTLFVCKDMRLSMIHHNGFGECFRLWCKQVYMLIM